MKYICFIFLGALLLYIPACDEDGRYYNYFDYSYIDTVLAADTIQNGEPVGIVYVYPAGCNHFERIESKEHGVSLELAVLYHFYFRGEPCAHGSGLDTTSYRLFFSSGDQHFLVYRKSEDWEVLRPIFVTK